jgi:hypothetical protein
MTGARGGGQPPWHRPLLGVLEAAPRCSPSYKSRAKFFIFQEAENIDKTKMSSDGPAGIPFL